MANELLIRLYDVGLGDCIYVRIPGETDANEKAFHMLIDCGTWSDGGLLTKAIEQLKSELPTEGSKKRLDLVVVTHEHKDHIAGFDPKIFEDVKVGAVWMNCVMNPKHPQAGKTRKVRAVAQKAMQSLEALGKDLSPRVAELLSVFQINNKGAMETLRSTLLKGAEPTYVSAGETNLTHDIKLHNATINVIGPESDFDGFYLGKTAENALRGVIGPTAFDAADDDAEDGQLKEVAFTSADAPLPGNISPASFRSLRARMQSNGLAFAELDGKLKNNSSVVLLIEWSDKRLLFVGDAEWSSDFKLGKMNGSWNVMWNKRKEILGKPVDFLKIGHHGSENATPWDMGNKKKTEAVDILEAILPLPKNGEQAKATAVVSTERGKYPTIPRALLMTEIARRIRDPRIYKPFLKDFKPKDPADFAAYEADWLNQAQPLRTDFERIRKATGYIDVLFQ
ncbi:MAG: metallohydrolase [Mesorhizobium sp.]|uniref:MBL fold metallo-hydrolase n=1 Tax=unclassified Mesorhizobium TaxID=325217 RepID=UPI000F74F6F7|nr:MULTISPECIES: MBL fold metallo-hydrolase [unclassified Mesorhizobium]AZO33575.1 metallohydrolase [Mesorhizobium sp. M2A.F.Ca.ET.046.03.2.1]RWB42787.1 MAG: metallohydrolase [Mesorhizobium sp.]RWE21994.1 MAG: metallohydrolase [Mesorhizobium sp.]